LNHMILLLIGFVTATGFCLALTPMVVKFAGLYGLFDRPDMTIPLKDPANPSPESRKVHSKPIPRLGGVAIVASFMLTQVLWVGTAPLAGVLVAGFAIFIVGLIDDIISIPARYRFIAQIFIATFAIKYHHLVPSLIDLGGGVRFQVPEILGLAFSVFVVVGSINTVNMIDGLDGLAGGMALIGVCLLNFLYFLQSHDLGLLLYVSTPMIGALIGFLRYNTHPAVIFMGDSGSNWLGFMVGMIMLLLLSGTQIDPNTAKLIRSIPVPLPSVIMCLAIPVFDTAAVMMGRVRRGTSPMQADKTHLHHALLKIGLSHPQAVSALYFLALIVGVIGILPVAYPNYNLDFAPYFGIMFSFTFVLVASRVNAEKTIGVLMERARLRERSEYSTVSKFVRYWENFNRYVLYSILLAGPAFAGSVRNDLGIAAAAVGLLIIASILIGTTKKADDFLDSACIALASTVLLVTNNTNTLAVEWQGQRVSIQHIYNGLFGLLLTSTILLFVLTAKRRYFIFKPSDFLLAAVPLILLLVPDPFRTEYRINIISLRSIVIFAAVRTLAKRKGFAMTHIKGVTLLALTFVFLAGVFGLRIVY
jgi:UDP-GlcNAc:undecaprenyl-phosphate/decaprenyl-phosphate GlcNAc-1-phosphate transferase